MLEQEYAQLMGIENPATYPDFKLDYTYGNQVYMACSDNMLKERFCNDWKEHKHSEIIGDLSRRVYFLDGKVKELRDIIQGGVADLVNVIRDLQNVCPDANTIRELEDRIDSILHGLTDRRTIVMKKLDYEVDLNEVDLAYIQENLK